MRSFDTYAARRALPGNGITSYGLRRRAQQVLDHIQSLGGAPGRVLDVGTADGQMLAVLAETLLPGLWVGVDYNPGLMDATRLPGDWLGGFARADGCRLPFRDASFDVLIAAATVKHVPRADRLFREARRVLRDGGCFIISDPTPHAIWLGLRMGHFDKRWLAHRWSLSDWRKEIEPAGFRLRRSERYMMLPFQVYGSERLEGFLAGTVLNRLFLHQAASFEAIAVNANWQDKRRMT